MRTSERGRITIPRGLRERFGLDHDVEANPTPTETGLLIHGRTAARQPVERVCAVLDTDNDIECVRWQRELV